VELEKLPKKSGGFFEAGSIPSSLSRDKPCLPAGRSNLNEFVNDCLKVVKFTSDQAVICDSIKCGGVFK
jgi:hypothetical protein